MISTTRIPLSVRATAAQTRVTGLVWCQWHGGRVPQDRGSRVNRRGRMLFKCFGCQAKQ